MNNPALEELTQHNLDVNTMAAKILSASFAIHPERGVLVDDDNGRLINSTALALMADAEAEVKDYAVSFREFNIFATTPQGAKDREDVVIALGEKHRLGFLCSHRDHWIIITWRSPSEARVIFKDADSAYDTYTDALSAAIQAASKGCAV